MLADDPEGLGVGLQEGLSVERGVGGREIRSIVGHARGGEGECLIKAGI